MCAINPTYKKRFVIDTYTANPNTTQEEFEQAAIHMLLQAEIKLNKSGVIRFHLKEVNQEAD